MYYIIPKVPFPLVFTAAYGWFLEALKYKELGIVELYGGYPPVISVFFGLLSTIYEIHPIYIFSITNYVGHLLYPIFAYVLCYRVTNNTVVSIFSSLISSWVYDSIALTCLYNRTLFFWVFPLMIYILLDLFESRLITFKYFLICSPLIFSPPYLLFILGYLAAKSLYSFPILLRNVLIPAFLLCSTHFVRNKELFLITLLLVAFSIIHPAESMLFSFLLYMFIFSKILTEASKLPIAEILTLIGYFINLLMASGMVVFSNGITTNLFATSANIYPFNLNSVQRYELMKTLIDPVVLHLFVVSIPFGLLSAKLEKNKNLTSFTFTSCYLFLLLLQPDGLIAWRASVFMNIPLAIMNSIVLFSPLYVLKLFSPKLRFTIRVGTFLTISKFKHGHFIIILLLFLIISTTTFPFFSNFKLNYINNFSKTNPNGYFSYIQPYEVEAAFWVYYNTPKNITIVSDPHTMYILKSLTLRETALREYRYIEELEYSNETKKRMQMLRLSFITGNISEVKRLTCNQSEILIIISPRTLAWIEENVMFPIYIKEFAFYDKSRYSNFQHLPLIFHDSNNQLYIYKLEI
jgi:hypothetical protein